MKNSNYSSSITRKIGVCECGYRGPLYSAGKCQSCYWKSRRKINEIKKSPLKHKIKSIGEDELFHQIWKERKHVSTINPNMNIDHLYGTDFWYNCFIHILAKGQNKYPEYKLKKENIVLGTPQEHLLIDMGSQEQRNKYEQQFMCSFEPFYKLQEELRIKYKEEYDN